MKKNLLILVLAILSLAACNTKKDFKVSVNLKNAEGKTIYLQKTIDSQLVIIDSAIIQNDIALLTSPFDDPSILYSIIVPGSKHNITFFSENQNMSVEGDINDFPMIKVIGSEAQNIINQYNAEILKYKTLQDEVFKKYKKASVQNDAVLSTQFFEEFHGYEKEKQAFIDDFVMKNKDSLISHYVLSNTYLYSDKDFKVSVNLKNAEGKTIYLQKTIDSQSVIIDSAIIQNDIALLTSPSDDPSILYSIIVPGSKHNITFFSENQNMSVEGDINDFPMIKIIGSEAQEIMNEFKAGISKYQILRDEIFKKNKKASAKNDQKFLEEYDAYQKEERAYIDDFIIKNKNSFISYYVLSITYTHLYSDLEKLENLFNELNKDIFSPYRTVIEEKLAIQNRVAVGNPYIDFTMATPDGSLIALSDIVEKSKLLLVDFWSSSCGSCRRENPNVIAIYNDFHDKGFDVVGVSLDKRKEKWIRAIAVDGLPWTNVSDLKQENEAARLYGIYYVPSNFLLDENGIIIAKNLKGDELREKVQEILK